MPATPSFRFARSSEIPELSRLVAHSFPGPARTPAWWAEQLAQPVQGGGADTAFVGEEAGRPVAVCQLHEFQQWIAGQAFRIAGVGTVAIAPTHRKRGIAAALVTAALRAARERGDVASALYPFRADFYRRLGYGQAGEALQYQIPPAALADSAERARVELLESDDARLLALDLYHRWIRTETGQLERGERLWMQRCAAHDRALVGYRNAEGDLEGYALAVYRTDLPVPQRYLEIDELVCASPAARRALYGWLASLGDQWPWLLVRALRSQRFGDRLREVRLPHGAAPTWGLWTPGATLLMGPMFRIVDMQRVWQQRRVVADAPALTARVDVTDVQIAENAGGWRLAFADGSVTVERDGETALTLRTDVATLSRVFIGSLTASAALDAALLECDRPERLATLDAVLAVPEPWTFDRF